MTELAGLWQRGQRNVIGAKLAGLWQQNSGEWAAQGKCKEVEPWNKTEYCFPMAYSFDSAWVIIYNTYNSVLGCSSA